MSGMVRRAAGRASHVVDHHVVADIPLDRVGPFVVRVVVRMLLLLLVRMLWVMRVTARIRPIAAAVHLRRKRPEIGIITHRGAVVAGAIQRLLLLLRMHSVIRHWRLLLRISPRYGAVVVIILCAVKLLLLRLEGRRILLLLVDVGWLSGWQWLLGSVRDGLERGRRFGCGRRYSRRLSRLRRHRLRL